MRGAKLMNEPRGPLRFLIQMRGAEFMCEPNVYPPLFGGQVITTSTNKEIDKQIQITAPLFTIQRAMAWLHDLMVTL